jgi:hypothetical protein
MHLYSGPGLVRRSDFFCFLLRYPTARKDVERAFRVLQVHFAVVRESAKQWDPETLWEVMTCCVIMHNMIVEDEGKDAAVGLEFDNMGDPIKLAYHNPTHI